MWIQMYSGGVKEEKRYRRERNRRARIPPFENWRTRIFTDSHILFTDSAIAHTKFKRLCLVWKAVKRIFGFLQSDATEEKQKKASYKRWRSLREVKALSELYIIIRTSLLTNKHQLRCLYIWCNVCQTREVLINHTKIIRTSVVFDRDINLDTHTQAQCLSYRDCFKFRINLALSEFKERENARGKQ